MSKSTASKPTPPEAIGEMFIDSGAHSLFNLHAHKKRGKDKYAWFETAEFWKYVDDYAAWIKANRQAIDYYVSVDVIHNPELSWKVQKYLEDKYGLEPVPVIHHGTSVAWLKKYLKQGYHLIGLGGVALRSTRSDYLKWADEMFEVICNTSDRLPSVRVHGFAMTAIEPLLRYPFWSVDSASWTKAGAFGMIYVPRRRNGKYDVLHPKGPYSVAVSSSLSARKASQVVIDHENTGFGLSGPLFVASSPSAKVFGRHITTMSAEAVRVVRGWLDEIEVPFGSIDDNGKKDEWGVVSHFGARVVANMKYFQALADGLPEYPWPFRLGNKRKGFAI